MAVASNSRKNNLICTREDLGLAIFYTGAREIGYYEFLRLLYRYLVTGRVETVCIFSAMPFNAKYTLGFFVVCQEKSIAIYILYKSFLDIYNDPELYVQASFEEAIEYTHRVSIFAEWPVQSR